MNCEKCKECKYYKVYYHGFGVNMVNLSYRCMWTLKAPENVTETECNKQEK